MRIILLIILYAINFIVDEKTEKLVYLSAGLIFAIFDYLFRKTKVIMNEKLGMIQKF